MSSILFLNGLPNVSNNLFFLKGDQLTIRYNGSSNVGSLLKTQTVEKLFAVVGFNESEVFSQYGEKIDCVFNEISDVDSHSESLKNAESILDSINVPIINHPKYIMQTSRDKIYEKLFSLDESLIVPKTILVSPGVNTLSEQIANAKMQFPLILRECGSHGGIDTLLIQDAIELTKLPDALLLEKQLYVTEFHEYKDESNLYTKSRLVVIDGEVYIRHWIHSKNWLVHARNRRREYDLLEKKKILSFDTTIKDKLKPLVAKIYDLVKLDYFGIDCHIDKNFNILLFELNATMNIFTSSGGSEHLAVSKLNEAVNRMIHRKIAANVCNK